jgi:long-chain fatty acid transport protein
MRINAFTASLLLATGAFWEGFTLPVFAGGFRLPDQDAFATARGEAFTATADNASAVYYNPAGLTQLQGLNLRGGIYGIYLDPSFKSHSGANFDNQNTLDAVPQLFGAYTLKNLPLSIGLGVYAPYGLGLKWPQDTGFRTLGTESSLTYISMNPVVAWRVFTNFSVAAGVSANYAKINLQEGLFWPTQPNDGFQFKGDGWAAGYNLGALYQPWEKLSFGATLRGPTKVTFSGQTDYHNSQAVGQIPAIPYQSVGAQADYSFPLQVVSGVSYRPTPKWNFEFDADYADWSTLGTVTFRQNSGYGVLLPKNIPVAFDWEPSWYFEFGGTRYLDHGWSLSAGYIYNETSVPNAHYTPLVTDLDKHFFSVGAGHKGKRYDFDIAYQFGYGPQTAVTGSAASAAGQTANGSYTYLSQAVLVTVGIHF